MKGDIIHMYNMMHLLMKWNWHIFIYINICFSLRCPKQHCSYIIHNPLQFFSSNNSFRREYHHYNCSKFNLKQYVNVALMCSTRFISKLSILVANFFGKHFRNKLNKEIVFCFMYNHIGDHLVHVFVVYDGYKGGSWSGIGKPRVFQNLVSREALKWLSSQQIFYKTSSFWRQTRGNRKLPTTDFSKECTWIAIMEWVSPYQHCV